jgi:hypothetical protein
MDAVGGSLSFNKQKHKKMKLITLLGLLPVLLFFPVTTGFVAMSLRRKFWFWFLAGISLPFLALVILLCLPLRTGKRKRNGNRMRAVAEHHDTLLIANY